jgi:hypothetical protein
MRSGLTQPLWLSTEAAQRSGEILRLEFWLRA